MVVEVDEEYGDWRDHLSKEDEACYLASVLDRIATDRHRVTVTAIVKDADGQERTITVKKDRRGTNERFRVVLDNLKEGERIVALRRVETFEWIVKDVPPKVLKKRLSTNKQRDRRHWGTRKRSAHLVPDTD